MTRFFFHLNNGTGLTLDHEGQEFPNRDAALSRAMLEVRAIIAADVRDGRAIAMSSNMIVDDEYGVEIGRVGFSDAVDIIE